MRIRRASEKEMLDLWGYSNYLESSPTAKFFVENLLSGNAEFWSIDQEGSLIGELYIFKKLKDTDFADGHTRAYLCAFRVQKKYRGKGLGSQLLEHVLGYLKESGFRDVTIGVEKQETANVRLYRRFGFEEIIKDCYLDPCDMDNEMIPKRCGCFWLLNKTLK